MKTVGVKSENEPDNEVDQRKNGQKDALLFKKKLSFLI